MATRRRFTREFKLEAVRLAREQGISVAEAARDLDLHENVLRKWIRLYEEDTAHAFPGPGQQKPDDAEIQALKREVRKLRAERDILKKAAALFANGSK
jgi:transposase